MPSLEQICGNGETIESGGEEKQALGAMVIGLMLISTFIVTLLIVSVVIKEAAVLREAGKIAQAQLGGASPEDYAEKKEEVYTSMQQKQQIPNVQYATFLVFALTMVYYLVYASLGFLTPVSLSPGFWLVSGSGLAMLIFVLALLVIVLGMGRAKVKKSIHI
jgi:competence protein ComGC